MVCKKGLLFQRIMAVLKHITISNALSPLMEHFVKSFEEYFWEIMTLPVHDNEQACSLKS